MDKLEKRIGHLVLSNLPNNLLILNQDDEIVFINQHMASTFDYTTNELMGQKLQMLIPTFRRNTNPEKPPVNSQNLKPYKIDGGFETIGLRKNAERFPVVLEMTSFDADVGNLTSVVIMDATMHREVQEELTTKNELLSLAEQLTQVGHWQWDLTTNEVTWSENLYTLFHQSRDGQLMYDTYFSYVHAEDKEYVAGQVEKIIRDKKFYDFFHRIKTGNGLVKIIHLSGKVFTDEKGEVIKMIGACQDVTRQKDHEQKLETFNQTLELKNEELKNFAHLVSHDLKEPLRTISAFSQILFTEHFDSLDKEGGELFGLILSATSRMKQQIDDLLNYSLAGTKRTQKLTDCNVVLDDVRKDLALAIDEVAAEIVIEELPVIQCYESELRLVFQNLISNALKFRRHKTKPIIKIYASLIDDSWKFSVQDNGIGIPLKDSTKIFQLFRRLHPYHEYKGTGIGLAYCQKIIELHQGKIWVKSEQNKGSTFYFTIPL